MADVSNRPEPHPVKPPRPVIPFDPNHACTNCGHMGTRAYMSEDGKACWRCPSCGYIGPIGGEEVRHG